jgi:hypothetical protein
MKFRTYTLVIFLIVSGFVCALQPVSVGATGLQMATYVAPDKSFSIYYPQGWTVKQGQESLSIVQNPRDPMSTGINILPFQFGQQYITSSQIINMLASQMQMQNPTFNLASTQQLSQQPDIMAASYSYAANNVTMVGLAIAISQGSQGYWAEIYGRQNGFTGYDPAQVLAYVVQSVNQGTTPNQPQMAQAQQGQGASQEQQLSPGEYQQRMNDAMVGTHMWNMAPYISPNMFDLTPMLPMW